MAKRVVLFFFIILFFFFAFADVRAQNAAINSLNEVKNAADNLKNADNLPVMEDVGLIASTIRNAAETYQSIKTKIAATIQYGQNITRSIEETAKKIINDGYKIKKYIDEKINYFSVKYKINSPLTQTI